MRIVRRRWRERSDRGVTIVIAAICLTLVLGAGALAIDLGVLRVDRRNMVSATDAAALAAGDAFARGDGDWSTQCADALHDNAPKAVLGECDASGNSADGVIKVEATQPVDFVLAPAFGGSGSKSGQVVSSSTVHVGIPSVVAGLRPLGLCINDMNPDNNGGHIKDDLVPLLMDTPPRPVTLDVSWGSDQVNDCRIGNNPDGPWAFLDFDPGQGNVDGRVADWTAHGYGGALGADPSQHLPELFATAPRSGQSSSDLSALDSTLSNLSGQQSVVALYDEAEPPQPDGAFATTVRVVAFVRAEFEVVDLRGSDSDRLKVRLFPWTVVEGSCCGVAGGLFDPQPGSIRPPALRTIRICSVDHATGDCDE
jgi:hypothetical protein